MNPSIPITIPIPIPILTYRLAENRTKPEIVSRSMTEEDKYYEELAFKDPAESIRRIEDTAKFLTGIAL